MHLETALFQQDFPPEEFAGRRARICDAIGEGAWALLQGAPAPAAYQAFRQHNEFYYCCGVEVPQAFLLFGGPERETRLYLPGRPPRHDQGDSLWAEDAELAVRLTGVSAVYPREQLAEHLQGITELYVPHRPPENAQQSRDRLQWAGTQAALDPWDGRPAAHQHWIALLRSRCPNAAVRDLSPVLDALRAVKSPREIALLREAGRLAALAVTEAMRVTQPGVCEYQLGALASYLYLVHGARGEGYRAILPSGENIWHVHYGRNDGVLKEGDLVLMDAAPDYRYYTSDIGRMWPVSGTYAPWQRRLYGFMVEYHKTLLRLIGPGRTPDEILAEAAGLMEPVVAGMSFPTPAQEAGVRKTLTFRGHLSHPVGMAVHDNGGYWGRPLQPGTVFTVDPQMWVPEERLYIRVEDTLVVTEDGIENLTAAAPLELDEIEATVRERKALPLYERS